ncbi:lipid A biosynthesis acyltransferase [Ottowia sp.]|uniref:lysophospholipid acyltransferase family protein n=1 Tax=Ottowia sp. TaxID=1898956 RepID=UPI002CA69842|nr:lipid A biosynthesis acyltransferase [Ottowia sp.]HOB65202.1 lipid A biosynthesis acyltransferase [Ottowia sp.]HPZ56788.1 lipid A biosynthesis acyltransferase [Ottowia sp.]HQD48184.1 lipid A biosynthesis acyltransferase [Ottowia sp.]
MTHPGVLLMQGLARLPLPWLRTAGAGLGRLLFMLARRRRHVALTNLRLCFPQWSERERIDVARRSFVLFTQSFIDRAWVWHAPDAVVRARIRLVGAVDELRKPEAAVLFAPHFYGMDAGGAAIMQQAVRIGGSIYSPQSGAATDAWVRAGRERFGDVVLINRRDGIKPVIKSLREGRYLYLLPDMDLGPEESIFVPFFGVPAATVPSLPRLARLGRARVVPTVTRMTADGYEVRVDPAWQDYPSDDVEADTALMNQRLEAWIRAMPEQYYWVHKRFKTRPPGQPPVY